MYHDIAESYPISKNLGDITKLLANIQKRWLESCLKKLKLFEDRSIYEVIDLSKRQKVIKNHWVFNIKSNSHFRFWLIAKEFSQVEDINFDELFSLVIYYKTVDLL